MITMKARRDQLDRALHAMVLIRGLFPEARAEAGKQGTRIVLMRHQSCFALPLHLAPGPVMDEAEAWIRAFNFLVTHGLLKDQDPTSVVPATAME
jgi:hypothetical protein